MADREVDHDFLHRRHVVDKGWGHRHQHEDSQRRHVEDEQVEVFVIVEPDAVVEPTAMVVEFVYAFAADQAMATSSHNLSVALGAKGELFPLP